MRTKSSKSEARPADGDGIANPMESQAITGNGASSNNPEQMPNDMAAGFPDPDNRGMPGSSQRDAPDDMPSASMIQARAEQDDGMPRGDMG